MFIRSCFSVQGAHIQNRAHRPWITKWAGFFVVSPRPLPQLPTIAGGALSAPDSSIDQKSILEEKGEAGGVGQPYLIHKETDGIPEDGKEVPPPQLGKVEHEGRRELSGNDGGRKQEGRGLDATHKNSFPAKEDPVFNDQTTEYYLGSPFKVKGESEEQFKLFSGAGSGVGTPDTLHKTGSVGSTDGPSLWQKVGGEVEPPSPDSRGGLGAGPVEANFQRETTSSRTDGTEEGEVTRQVGRTTAGDDEEYNTIDGLTFLSLMPTSSTNTVDISSVQPSLGSNLRWQPSHKTTVVGPMEEVTSIDSALDEATPASPVPIEDRVIADYLAHAAATLVVIEIASTSLTNDDVGGCLNDAATTLVKAEEEPPSLKEATGVGYLRGEPTQCSSDYLGSRVVTDYLSSTLALLVNVDDEGPPVKKSVDVGCLKGEPVENPSISVGSTIITYNTSSTTVARLIAKEGVTGTDVLITEGSPATRQSLDSASDALAKKQKDSTIAPLKSTEGPVQAFGFVQGRSVADIEGTQDKSGSIIMPAAVPDVPVEECAVNSYLSLTFDSLIEAEVAGKALPPQRASTTCAIPAYFYTDVNNPPANEMVFKATNGTVPGESFRSVGLTLGPQKTSSDTGAEKKRKVGRCAKALISAEAWKLINDVMLISMITGVAAVAAAARERQTFELLAPTRHVDGSTKSSFLLRSKEYSQVETQNLLPVERLELSQVTSSEDRDLRTTDESSAISNENISAGLSTRDSKEMSTSREKDFPSGAVTAHCLEAVSGPLTAPTVVQDVLGMIHSMPLRNISESSPRAGITMKEDSFAKLDDDEIGRVSFEEQHEAFAFPDTRRSGALDTINFEEGRVARIRIDEIGQIRFEAVQESSASGETSAVADYLEVIIRQAIAAIAAIGAIAGTRCMTKAAEYATGEPPGLLPTEVVVTDTDRAYIGPVAAPAGKNVVERQKIELKRSDSSPPSSVSLQTAVTTDSLSSIYGGLTSAEMAKPGGEETLDVSSKHIPAINGSRGRVSENDVSEDLNKLPSQSLDSPATCPTNSTLGTSGGEFFASLTSFVSLPEPEETQPGMPQVTQHKQNISSSAQIPFQKTTGTNVTTDNIRNTTTAITKNDTPINYRALRDSKCTCSPCTGGPVIEADSETPNGRGDYDVVDGKSSSALLRSAVVSEYLSNALREILSAETKQTVQPLSTSEGNFPSDNKKDLVVIPLTHTRSPEAVFGLEAVDGDAYITSDDIAASLVLRLPVAEAETKIKNMPGETSQLDDRRDYAGAPAQSADKVYVPATPTPTASPEERAIGSSDLENEPILTPGLTDDPFLNPSTKASISLEEAKVQKKTFQNSTPETRMARLEEVKAMAKTRHDSVDGARASSAAWLWKAEEGDNYVEGRLLVARSDTVTWLHEVGARAKITQESLSAAMWLREVGERAKCLEDGLVEAHLEAVAWLHASGAKAKTLQDRIDEAQIHTSTWLQKTGSEGNYLQNSAEADGREKYHVDAATWLSNKGKHEISLQDKAERVRAEASAWLRARGLAGLEQLIPSQRLTTTVERQLNDDGLVRKAQVEVVDPDSSRLSVTDKSTAEVCFQSVQDHTRSKGDLAFAAQCPHQGHGASSTTFAEIANADAFSEVVAPTNGSHSASTPCRTKTFSVAGEIVVDSVIPDPGSGGSALVDDDVKRTTDLPPLVDHTPPVPSLQTATTPLALEGSAAPTELDGEKSNRMLEVGETEWARVSLSRTPPFDALNNPSLALRWAPAGGRPRPYPSNAGDFDSTVLPVATTGKGSFEGGAGVEGAIDSAMIFTNAGGSGWANYLAPPQQMAPTGDAYGNDTFRSAEASASTTVRADSSGSFIPSHVSEDTDDGRAVMQQDEPTRPWSNASEESWVLGAVQNQANEAQRSLRSREGQSIGQSRRATAEGAEDILSSMGLVRGQKSRKRWNKAAERSRQYIRHWARFLSGVHQHFDGEVNLISSFCYTVISSE